jgi:hypothetical protein
MDHGDGICSVSDFMIKKASTPPETSSVSVTYSAPNFVEGVNPLSIVEATTFVGQSFRFVNKATTLEGGVCQPAVRWNKTKLVSGR